MTSLTKAERAQERVPRDLHEREYAIKVCENLMWPNVPSNLQLVMEAIFAISHGKLCRDRPHPKYAAWLWLTRQIEWAQKQSIVIDGFFFRDGGYTRVPPLQDDPKLLPFVQCGKDGCVEGFKPDGKGKWTACQCRLDWVAEAKKRKL